MNSKMLPNTPEANTPEPEYESGEPAAPGPMDLGQPHDPTVPASHASPEALPDSLSTSQLVQQSRNYGGGGF
jgi:hypothetical protein